MRGHVGWLVKWCGTARRVGEHPVSGVECVICRGVLGALVEAGVKGGAVRSGCYAATGSSVAL